MRTRRLGLTLSVGILLSVTPGVSQAIAAPRAVTGSTITRVTTTAGTISPGPLVVDRAALMALPTSGSAWLKVLSTANAALGAVDLQDQDSTTAARAFAAALVYARTGQAAYRDKVVATLRVLPAAPLGTARVLSVSRQLAGYVIAADLVGYRDAAFVSFVSRIRTQDIGNHGRWYAISQTSEDSANNWGTWALASRLAASRFLGDLADVDRAAAVFRGFLGDRTAYAGFRRTADLDPTWACGAAWVPVNPPDCGDRAGALVEDISRSSGSYPTVDTTGRTYSWEALGGATLTATLLARSGYPDVYDWSDRALLRAARFLQAHGGYAPSYGSNQYIPWAINRAYGTDLGPVNPAGFGRQYGFTDWLP